MNSSIVTSCGLPLTTFYALGGLPLPVFLKTSHYFHSFEHRDFETGMNLSEIQCSIKLFQDLALSRCTIASSYSNIFLFMGKGSSLSSSSDAEYQFGFDVDCLSLFFTLEIFSLLNSGGKTELLKMLI
jgi:hypothetical protein